MGGFLRERDKMLEQIKLNLLRAQELMKRTADGHQRDIKFEVGASVCLKLKPYHQQFVAKRVCQKLAAKFFGPFTILERVGKTAYKLQLSDTSRIHPVFHVSQLKLALGSCAEVHLLPLESLHELDALVVPEEVVAKRYDKKGLLELFVQWKVCPTHESSWMLYVEFVEQFPHFKLEDKLDFKGESVDKYQRAYVR